MARGGNRDPQRMRREHLLKDDRRTEQGSQPEQGKKVSGQRKAEPKHGEEGICVGEGSIEETAD